MQRGSGFLAQLGVGTVLVQRSEQFEARSEEALAQRIREAAF
jgi:hypothetical protein